VREFRAKQGSCRRHSDACAIDRAGVLEREVGMLLFLDLGGLIRASAPGEIGVLAVSSPSGAVAASG